MESRNKEITLLILVIIGLFLVNMAHGQTKQLSLLGITAHGTHGNEAASKEMKNKLTRDGFLALNPQFNFTYNKENGTFYNTSIVVDCYGHFASFLGYGKKYKVESDLKLGYMIGLYSRLFPKNEELTFGKVGAYQFLPFPALVAEYKISEKVSIRLSANYLINFFDFAWEF